MFSVRHWLRAPERITSPIVITLYAKMRAVNGIIVVLKNYPLESFFKQFIGTLVQKVEYLVALIVTSYDV